MSKSTKYMIVNLFGLVVAWAIVVWFTGQVLGYQNSTPGMVINGFCAAVYFAMGWQARNDLKADE